MRRMTTNTPISGGNKSYKIPAYKEFYVKSHIVKKSCIIISSRDAHARVLNDEHGVHIRRTFLHLLTLGTFFYISMEM